MTEWQNQPNNIDELFGFTYLIINNITGQKYVGKKFYHETVKRPPLKGRTKQEKIKYKNNKRKRHVTKQSDWKDYYGSSKQLLQDVEEQGKENFTRIILNSYATKWECAYYEVVEQINRQVLFDNNYYNGIVNCRVPKAPKHLRID